MTTVCNKCKQYKSYKDKTFLRDLQMHVYCKNVSSIEVAIQELSWGGGGGRGESRNQGVGQKHLGMG